MTQKVPVTVAHGDGIGPEIMAAVLHILDAARARIETETIEIGEAVFLRGNTAGIEAESWESLRRTKVFLKAPITTPQGGGFKSLNVTARKTLGLYANVRPCVSYHPYVQTKHPGMNVVIVRGERGGHLRRHRASADGGRDAMPENHHAAGLRADSAIRVRVRGAKRPREGHLLQQRQYHEDDGRAVPPGVRRDRLRVSGHRSRALDRGHRSGEDGGYAGDLRRDRDAEPVRRHPVGRGGADRGLGRAGGIGEHR